MRRSKCNHGLEYEKSRDKVFELLKESIEEDPTLNGIVRTRSPRYLIRLSQEIDKLDKLTKDETEKSDHKEKKKEFIMRTLNRELDQVPDYPLVRCEQIKRQQGTLFTEIQTNFDRSQLLKDGDGSEDTPAGLSQKIHDFNKEKKKQLLESKIVEIFASESRELSCHTLQKESGYLQDKIDDFFAEKAELTVEERSNR